MILAGVLGDPIAHSLSPKLHGHWLARLGIDGAYVPLHVRPEDLADALRLLPRLGFRGVNVTIPHKAAALVASAHVTDRARRIGAANTLTFAEDGLHADNTDAPGFLANLDAAGPWDAERPAVVLGAGGAARAIVVALQDRGVPRIRLANRTRARAEALAAEFGGIDVAPLDDPGLRDAGLVVNTTALGMAGQPPLALDLAPLPPDAVVTDIVYAPLDTPLLQAAAARGLRTVDGLGMLLHQAAPGFRRWFGAEPVVDDALRAAVLA